jgi:hypothetical protein
VHSAHPVCAAIGNDRQKKTRAANSGSLCVPEETEILIASTAMMKRLVESETIFNNRNSVSSSFFVGAIHQEKEKRRCIHPSPQ